MSTKPFQGCLRGRCPGRGAGMRSRHETGAGCKTWVISGHNNLPRQLCILPGLRISPVEPSVCQDAEGRVFFSMQELEELDYESSYLPRVQLWGLRLKDQERTLLSTGNWELLPSVASDTEPQYLSFPLCKMGQSRQEGCCEDGCFLRKMTLCITGNSSFPKSFSLVSPSLTHHFPPSWLPYCLIQR